MLIDQTPDQRWRYDIITNVPGLVYGTPEGAPGHKTRQAVEVAAIAGLAALGRRAVPAPDYDPIPDSDNLIEIILGDTRWAVSDWPPEVVEELLGMLDTGFGHSVVEITAHLADKLVADFDPKNRNDQIALTLLANCGWTNVSRTIVDEFCAANGIEL